MKKYFMPAALAAALVSGLALANADDDAIPHPLPEETALEVVDTSDKEPGFFSRLKDKVSGIFASDEEVDAPQTPEEILDSPDVEVVEEVPVAPTTTTTSSLVKPTCFYDRDLPSLDARAASLDAYHACELKQMFRERLK